jgi:hypothetical protein
MKKVFITHATKEYLEVAKNLAKSVRMFSDIPFLIYCVDCKPEKNFFGEIENIDFRVITLNVDRFEQPDDYFYNTEGNFYVNRHSTKIYHILCAKTMAMENALIEGWEEVCYLDSDCLATPLVNELFDWCSIITDYPIATEGIHQYMIMIENDFQRGNPFLNSWPEADHKLTLEWPLMDFLEIPETSRGTYRTTGIMLMNKGCLPFIRTWREFCFLLPKLVDTKKYAAFHEETIYNVLSWKKTNEGFPLCYINLREGLENVKFLFSEESRENFYTFDDSGEDTSLNFFRIPEDKRYVKVLHGEKRTEEVDKILEYLKDLNDSGYFPKN